MLQHAENNSGLEAGSCLQFNLVHMETSKNKNIKLTRSGNYIEEVDCQRDGPAYSLKASIWEALINTPCRLHQSIVTLNNAYRKHALARICWSSIYIDLLLYTEMLDLFLLAWSRLERTLGSTVFVLNSILPLHVPHVLCLYC